MHASKCSNPHSNILKYHWWHKVLIGRHIFCCSLCLLFLCKYKIYYLKMAAYQTSVPCPALTIGAWHNIIMNHHSLFVSFALLAWETHFDLQGVTLQSSHIYTCMLAHLPAALRQRSPPWLPVPQGCIPDRWSCKSRPLRIPAESLQLFTYIALIIQFLRW